MHFFLQSHLPAHIQLFKHLSIHAFMHFFIQSFMHSIIHAFLLKEQPTRFFQREVGIPDLMPVGKYGNLIIAGL
jgi:hypothetical protein